MQRTSRRGMDKIGALVGQAREGALKRNELI